MIYKMTLKDSVDTMTFNLLETPIVDKDIEGAVDNVTLDGNQYTDYLYLKKQYIQKWAIMCPDGYDELRGFYTRQFEDGEVPSYRLYYGANVTRDYTLNGDYFQFNAEGIETGMTLSQLLGNAEQTTYSGKNLLPPTADWTQTVSDVTVKCENGVYTFNGTSTANGSTTARATIAPYTIQAGDYFHYGNSFASPNINIQLIFTDSTSFATSMNVTNRVFPIDNYNGTSYVGKTISSCRVNFASGFAFNGTVSPMILHNVSTVADYEPYVGGIPAPNPSYPQAIKTVTGEQTVQVTGKNLFNKDATVVGSANCTYTYENGVFTITNTNANNPQITLAIDLPVGSYVLNSASYLSRTTQLRGNNAAVANLGSAYQNATFTATSDADSIRFNWLSTTDTITLDLNTLQIEVGSTPTAYEPYQGRRSYEVNLGKNLIKTDNLSTRVSGGFTTTWANNVGDTTGTATGTSALITDSITTGVNLPAGTYTFSVQTATTQNMGMNFYNADTSAWETVGTIPAGSLKYTFTTTFKATGWRIGYAGLTANTSYTLKCDRPMIEAGTQATSYASYFTPIELAKVGDYQDRVYKDDGKWYIEKNVGKVVFDSTNASSIVQNALNPNRYLNPSGSTIFTGLALGLPSYQSICSHYTFVRNGTAWQGIGKCGFDSTGTFWLMDSTTDLPTLRAWLASEGVCIYYPLATPTTTEITDETLLLQLNFLASLYGGVNNISLVGTGAQGEMEVFIRDVMSVETDVVPEVPVRLTLTDDGVINACGCRRNVQLTMRETTE